MHCHQLVKLMTPFNRCCNIVAGGCGWDKLVVHLMMNLLVNHCLEAHELIKMILWDVLKIMMNNRTLVTLKICTLINLHDKM